MRVDRFKAYLRDLLEHAPGVESVDEYESPDRQGRPNLRVRGTDGVTLSLVVVSTARTGGDDYGKPEEIVTKDKPGVSIS